MQETAYSLAGGSSDSLWGREKGGGGGGGVAC